MKPFHYTACGLNNVFIHGLDVVCDDAGNDTFHIPRINQLHRVIAEGIVSHEFAMDGSELRFLRTEMGYTQARLAEIMKVKPLTVGRWERSDTPIGAVEEAFIRKHAIETLKLPVEDTIEQLSTKNLPSNGVQEINVAANDNSYVLDPRLAA